MKIRKKTWPEYFQAILDGEKTYELRLADWHCKRGDVLVLEEWEPKTRKYTGRTVEKKVTYVGKFKIDKLFWPEKDIKQYGLQVIGFK